MDSEKDIEIAVGRLVKDNALSKLQALSVLHSKYQSERHLEEVVIVNRLIAREKLKKKQNQIQDFMMICNTDTDLGLLPI